MVLKSLSLINYKNFASKTFDFDRKINCLVGENGRGKTNVLDAVYHLALGKSYFNTIASQNIRHGEDFYVVNGDFEINKQAHQIVCSLKKGQKKVIKNNGKAYDRFADHIGIIPLVIISPSDSNLIEESSGIRRKMIDGILSQSNKSYLETLLNYNKILGQRNALLKYFAWNRVFDEETLRVYNDQLHEYGTFIFEQRKQFLEIFIPIFEKRYETISKQKEKVTIKYNSSLSKYNLKKSLEDNINKDKQLQYTSVGIHKDDLSFLIEQYPIKKFGSQGQQKSFLIALKLAQFDFMKEKFKNPPILLLDDIFDKLDEQRIKQLIALVNDNYFGQIFISDTQAERTENVIKDTQKSYKIFVL